MPAPTTEIERMVVRLVGEGSDFQRMLKEAQSGATAAAAHVQQAATRIEQMGGGLRGFAAQALAGITSLIGGVGLLNNVFKGVQLASEAEKNEIAFGTMLKSVELGKQMVQDLQEFAAATPLNAPDIQQATKTLLQFGTAGADILPTLKMLGDVTGGDAGKFNQLAYAFGQMQSTGRLMGQDLMQMINVGFNPLQEISRKTGKSIGELKQIMEKGGISVQMVKDAFKTATSEGGQFFNLMEKQSKSVGGLFSTMQDDISSALRQVGVDVIELFSLKDAMQEISAAAQSAQKFIADMDPGLKRLLGVAAAIGLAFGAFMLLWPAIGAVVLPILAGIKAAFLFLISPIGIVIALIAGLVAIVVAKFGGVRAVFGMIKAKALEAWEWIKPVRQALVSFFEAAWQKGKEAFDKIWQFVSDTWQKVKDTLGTAGIDWDEIRDGVRDAVLYAEFALDHFQDIAELAWAYAKLQFIVFADTIVHFFTKQLPALLDWFSRNWKEVLETAFNFATAVAKNYFENYGTMLKNMLNLAIKAFQSMGQLGLNLGHNIAELFSNLSGLIKGDIDIKDIWKPLTNGLDMALKDFDISKGMKPLTDGFKSTIKELPNLPQREIGKLEKRLREEFEAKKGALGESWQQFKARKLAEFGVSEAGVEEAKKLAQDSGKAIGESMNKGLKDETKKMDAVLVGSAEALSRIADYREMLAKRISSPEMQPGALPKAGNVNNNFGVENKVAVKVPATQQGKNEAVPVLQDIKSIMEKIAASGGGALKVAGVEE